VVDAPVAHSTQLGRRVRDRIDICTAEEGFARRRQGEKFRVQGVTVGCCNVDVLVNNMNECAPADIGQESARITPASASTAAVDKNIRRYRGRHYVTTMKTQIGRI
jgi:hypothetical protein